MLLANVFAAENNDLQFADKEVTHWRAELTEFIIILNNSIKSYFNINRINTHRVLGNIYYGWLQKL